MIGSLDPQMKKSVVIGGGIAGLIAAYRLIKAGHSVQLYEKTHRLGGLIRTYKRDAGMATERLVETAAHSFLASPAVIDFCQELLIPLADVRSDSKTRFILKRGHARTLPAGILRILGVFGTLNLVLRLILVLFKNPKNLREWGNRHLSKKATDYLLVPFLRGIYGARPEDLDVEMTFPRLAGPRGHSIVSRWIAERVTRRLDPPFRDRRARNRMVAPRDGMESCVRLLERALRSSGRCEIFLDHPVDGAWLKKMEEENPNTNWVFALPAKALAALLEEKDPETTEALRRVRHVPLVTVTVLAPDGIFHHGVPCGVGILVPEREKDRRCLGILFNSSSFPERCEIGFSSYTMMFSELPVTSDVRPFILREFQEVLRTWDCRIAGNGDGIKIDMTAWQEALPVYGPDLKAAWERARRNTFSKPGRVWFSNASGQISLRGMIETKF